MASLTTSQAIGGVVGMLLAARLTRGTNAPVMLAGGGVGYVAGGMVL